MVLPDQTEGTIASNLDPTEAFTGAGETSPAFFVDVDLHGRGHAGDQTNAFRNLVDSDAYGHPLRQTHPGENRVDRGKPLLVGARVGDIDAACRAGDGTMHEVVVTHQFDTGRITIANGGELRLFKISI